MRSEERECSLVERCVLISQRKETLASLSLDPFCRRRQLYWIQWCCSCSFSVSPHTPLLWDINPLHFEYQSKNVTVCFSMLEPEKLKQLLLFVFAELMLRFWDGLSHDWIWSLLFHSSSFLQAYSFSGTSPLFSILSFMSGHLILAKKHVPVMLHWDSHFFNYLSRL